MYSVRKIKKENLLRLWFVYMNQRLEWKKGIKKYIRNLISEQ